MKKSLHSGALRAPGKMFWIGEYSVLFGGPALVAAVDRYAVAQYRTQPSRDGDDLRIQSTHAQTPFIWNSDSAYSSDASSSGGSSAGPESEWSLVRSVLHTLHTELPDFQTPGGFISLDSSALQSDSKLGLGSSGAIAVLATAALTACVPISREEIESLALLAHHHFQGRTGSGGDVIASARGGLTRIQGEGRIPVSIPSSLSYGALYTGVSASTPVLVSRMKVAAERNVNVRELIDNLATISNRAILSLQAARTDSWLACVREFHATEVELTKIADVDIVTDEVQACVDLAARFGCAAKASGAGGGDVVVVFADSPESLRRTKAASEDAGVAFIDLRLDQNGLMPLQLEESLPES